MRGAGNAGYILVAVLGVMLTVTGLITSASVYTHTILQSAAVDQGKTETMGLVMSGMELTAYQLFVVKQPLAAVDGRRIHVTGATIIPAISDEAGKIDVNMANITLLESAFRAAGLTPRAIADLVSRIDAWRGISRAAGGAAPAVKHTPFRSVEDFMAFAGLAVPEGTALAPLLTVYNNTGMVNIMTAERRVLMALPGMTSVAADDLIAKRAHADPAKNADRDNLLSAFQNQRAFITATDGPVYGVELEVVAETGRISHEAAYIAKSTLAADPYLILRWGH